MGLGSMILPVGLLIAGWAVEWRVHWIVVDIVRWRNDWLKLLNFMLIWVHLRAMRSLQQVLFWTSSWYKCIFWTRSHYMWPLVCSSLLQQVLLIYLSLFSYRTCCNIFLWSLAGFGFPLFAPAMFHALGYGKGCTVLAGVSIVLGCPTYIYVCVITPPDVCVCWRRLCWQTVDFLEVREMDTDEQYICTQGWDIVVIVV